MLRRSQPPCPMPACASVPSCSGRVIKARYNGELVAAKEMPLQRGVEAQQAFLEEAAALVSVRHPHLVIFRGVALEHDGSKGILLMELCEGEAGRGGRVARW